MSDAQNTLERRRRVHLSPRLCTVVSYLTDLSVELGGAVDVIACASHGVLSGPAVERIEKSVLKEVYFLDTVPPKAGVACDKIKYLSVAHMFAEAIERIYEEVSVSKLFV